jgi:cell division protein FtsB
VREEEAQIENDKKEIAALDQRNADLAAQLATLQRQVAGLLSAHAH